MSPVPLSGTVLLLILLCGCGGGSPAPSGNGGGGYKPPPLSITSISPSSMTYGVSLGAVTIRGTGFTLGAVVLLDGVPIQNQYPYETQNILQVQLPNAVDTDLGVHQISVQQGNISNSLPFTVYRPQPGPDLMACLPGYFVGQVTGGSAVADVNGDGRSDVIISGPSSYTGNHISLTVLYGQADGTLSAPQYVSIPDVGFSALAAGDIDGDGKADIVTFTRTGGDTITLMAKLGDGQGNFSTVSTQTSTGGFPGTAYLTDLDGDGKPDALLTFGSLAGTFVEWFKNLGGGNFAPPVILAAVQDATDTVYAADFNRDGNVDILYTPPNQPAHILFGSGNGTFAVQPVSGINGVMGRPTVLDFNLDGIPDLVIQSPGLAVDTYVPVQMYSYAGNGDGTFTLVASRSLGVPFESYRMVSGDFDHDGYPDMAGQNGDGQPAGVMYFWGDGRGNFTPQMVTGPHGFSPMVGDFNGDGIPDVVVQDGVAAYLALGRTDRNVPSAVTLTPPTTANVSVGDINGDGLKDILVGGDIPTSTPATVYENMGNNTFRQGPSASPEAFAMHDLTGRGVADLMGTVMVGVLNQLEIWPNPLNGSLDFSTSTPMIVSNAGTGFTGGSTVTDVDGDGHPDIVTSYAIYYGNGAYQFAVMPMQNLGTHILGDFNGDGKLDIQTDGTMFLNSGGRTFRPVTNGLILSGSTSFATGDLNGDGKDDLIVTDPSGFLIDIYYSNGDGTFTLASLVSCGDQIGIMDVVDMNGDGRKDIVAAFTTQGACVLFNNGQGLFTASYFATGASANLMRIADMNGDGKPDVVILHTPATGTPNVDVVFPEVVSGGRVN